MNSVLRIHDEEKIRLLLPRIIRPEGFSQQETATGPVHFKQPLPKSST